LRNTTMLEDADEYSGAAECLFVLNVRSSKASSHWWTLRTSTATSGRCR